MHKKFTVCIDPGHGGTKGSVFFRVGQFGLREEEVNVRVALALKKLLLEEDIGVVLTREEDKFIELQERVDIAREAEANIFISIHHSVARDRSLNYSIVYFYKNAMGNPASVDLASYLAYYFKKRLKLSAYVYSDHLVFSQGFHVLRNLKDEIPAIIGEASFLSHPQNELLLQREDFITKEAECYKEAIVEYFESGIPSYTLVSKDDDQDLIIELDDGFGGTHFLDTSLRVIIDNKNVPYKLSVMKKLVAVENKKQFGEGSHELILRGENRKNNSIHPKPFIFNNLSDGTEWKAYITSAKKFYSQACELHKNNNFEKVSHVANQAIEALFHSLRILPVHEKVDEVYYYLVLSFRLINDTIHADHYIKNLKNYTPTSEYIGKIDSSIIRD